jgi:hypothetical protein
MQGWDGMHGKAIADADADADAGRNGMVGQGLVRASLRWQGIREAVLMALSGVSGLVGCANAGMHCIRSRLRTIIWERGRLATTAVGSGRLVGRCSKVDKGGLLQLTLLHRPACQARTQAGILVHPSYSPIAMGSYQYDPHIGRRRGNAELPKSHRPRLR